MRRRDGVINAARKLKNFFEKIALTRRILNHQIGIRCVDICSSSAAGLAPTAHLK